MRRVRYAKPELLCHPTKRRTCSNCSYSWEGFYGAPPFVGPPNYCPRCGAMNECRSEQREIPWPVGDCASAQEDGDNRCDT